jgi:uncharacterized membrane protein YkgB
VHLSDRVYQADRTIIHITRKIAIPALRIALAITYIWFGALKIVGASPVEDLVAKTLRPLPKQYVVPFLGLWEMLVGIGMLFRLAPRLTLALFFLQLGGTFATLIIRPQDTFQKKNPLLLSKDGEFVLKNLVLLAAGIALASRAHRSDEEIRG